MLIAHQDELDQLIEQMCLQFFPHLVGQEYLVLGTIERKTWKEGTASVGEMFESLHDFKKYLEFEPARYMWVQDE